MYVCYYPESQAEDKHQVQLRNDGVVSMRECRDCTGIKMGLRGKSAFGGGKGRKDCFLVPVWIDGTD